jgi:Co/Zn/Cd efflux system component
MSEAFGFMFAFYGLLLGLAVAEIASGFSRAYDERHKRRLGIIAPLFGALLLIDLITFWMNAWAYRNLPDISYLLALVVAVVALLYYFAATQVFPKSTEKDTLDHHIMENRRAVIFCVLASNVLTQVPNVISAFTTPWPMSEVVPWAGLNLIYYILLSTAALAKSKAVVGSVVGLAILFVTGVTLIFA